MRASAILSECWRNWTSGNSRAFVWATVTLLFGGGFGILDAMSVAFTEERAQDFRRNGGMTVTVSDGPIDVQACDALADHDSIRASGAVKALKPLRPSAARDTSLPQLGLSPGLFELLGVPVERRTAGLGSVIAERIGLGLGDSIRLNTGEYLDVDFVRSYPETAPEAPLSLAVLTAMTPGSDADECWIEYERATTDSPLPRTVLTSADAPGSVDPFQPALGAESGAVQEFESRSTRFAAPAAWLVGFGLGSLAVWLRRKEVAVANHFGEDLLGLTARMIVDALGWLLIGCLAAFLVGDMFSATEVAAAASRRPPLMLGSGGVFGTILAVIIAARRSIRDYLRS